ncbi:MAG: hypothetical protein U9R75_12750 [Candidatus Thermoplasmatota archaeon]|nr:hypothetical protein [Candidatus Thermoplasmatota archaeon]
MGSNDEEGGSEKDSWLSQHDSIQDELLKMKEELVREKYISDEPEPVKELSSGITKDTEIASIPSQEVVPEAEPVQTFPQGEMSIKQLLGPDKEDGVRPAPEQGFPDTSSSQKKDPPRLEKGKIPVSADLMGKIANVLMLEDDLKRRKFEREKKQRQINLPPPPEPPKSSRVEGEKEGPSNDRPVAHVKPNIVEQESSSSDSPPQITKTKKRKSVRQRVKAQEMPDDRRPVLEELTREDIETELEPVAEKKQSFGPLRRLRRLIGRE